MVQPTMGSRCIQAISVRDKTPSKFENLWRLLFKTVKVELLPCLIHRVQAPRHEDIWGSGGAHPHHWSVLLASVSSFIMYFLRVPVTSSPFASNVILSTSFSYTHNLCSFIKKRINSMELSPSWEAVSSAATQDFTILDWSQRFSAVFKTAFHRSLSWTRSVHSIPPLSYPIPTPF
jgi:hypothetical protein